jgi:dihydrofolate reductase
MRKISVISMISLDGVMQAPGGPDEDVSGDFNYGGWSAPFGDDESNKIMQSLMEPKDLLLGRTTFEIWENYWPHHTEIWPTINEVHKYVVSTTRRNSDWKNTEFINGLEGIKKLKNTKGSDLQVWGSSVLIQTLLTNDLVDELCLIFHPITLGKGKKLFTDGAIPASFTLLKNTATPSGLIIATFKRAGKVQTGNSGEK